MAAMDLIDTLMGKREGDPPKTPQEVVNPPHKRHHTPEHPIVGSRAPASPPPGPTIEQQLIEHAQHLHAVTGHVTKLAALVETLAELHRQQERRNAPIYDDVSIGNGQSGAYKVATRDRLFNRVYVGSEQTVNVLVPGLAPITVTLTPGWNPLDLPEATRVYTSQTAFQAIWHYSDAPASTTRVSGMSSDAVLVPGVGQQPAYGVNAGVDANGNPYAIYPSSVARLLYQSAANMDASAASGTFVSNLDVSTCSVLLVLFRVTALSGGASPTVQFVMKYQDGFGGLMTFGAMAALSTVTYQLINYGNTPGVGGTNAQGVLPQLVNLQWATTGAPATATVEVTVFGR